MLEKSFVKGSLLLGHSFYFFVQLVERQFWIWPPSFFARSSVLSCSIMFYPWTSHAQACASILLHLLQLASASAALWSRSQWLVSLESFQQGKIVHYNYTESQVRLPRLRLWLRLCIVLVLRRHIDIVYINISMHYIILHILIHLLAATAFDALGTSLCLANPSHGVMAWKTCAIHEQWQVMASVPTGIGISTRWW